MTSIWICSCLVLQEARAPQELQDNSGQEQNERQPDKDSGETAHGLAVWLPHCVLKTSLVVSLQSLYLRFMFFRLFPICESVRGSWGCKRAELQWEEDTRRMFECICMLYFLEWGWCLCFYLSHSSLCTFTDFLNSSKGGEEQQQEDQETTPKRTGRRGRPSKAAATEDSGKMWLKRSQQAVAVKLTWWYKIVCFSDSIAPSDRPFIYLPITQHFHLSLR